MDKPKGGDVHYNNFEIRGTLGTGGIGRVLLAFDTKLRRDVAIKELNLEKLGAFKDRATARFLREAKISGQLEHPGIVPVYQLEAKPDGAPFYVMKHVQGITLHDAMGACFGATPEEAFRNRLKLLDSLISVVEAVAYAHSRGVIHRDLKPANIILGEFGETIILDWGLAKVWREQGFDEPRELSISSIDLDEIDPFETRQGALIGTPSYMAPEQIDKKFGDVDPRTDVYALGILFFMLLSGEKPYLGTTKDIISQIVSDAVSPSPRSCGNFAPPELCAICEKAMSKDREKRFKDASEMARELKAYRDGRLVSVYAYSGMEILKRFVARNKAPLSAALAIVLAIIAGAGFSLHFAYDAQRARISAENALVEVTNLSQDAMQLARKSAENLDAYVRKTKSKTIDAATIQKLLPTDPLKSDYQFWCMQNDGYIIYDEDPKQIGLMLFSDKLYANFPELLEFGEKIRSDPIGVSYYSFLSKDSQNVVYKVAAWDTIETLDWKIVVTHPYMTK